MVIIDNELWRDFQDVARSYGIEFIYSHEEDGIHIYGDMEAAAEIVWAIDALDGTGLENIRKELLMKRTQFIVLMVLMVVAGLIGGFVSDRVSASGQGHEKVIITEEFRLVNSDGEKVGSWVADPLTGPALHFYDKSGKGRISIGMVLDNPMITLSSKEHHDIELAGHRASVPNSSIMMTLGASSFDQPLIKLRHGDAGIEIKTFTLNRLRSHLPSIDVLDTDGDTIWRAP